MLEKKTKNKILIILTGGTICSTENEKGVRTSTAKKAQTKIVADFKNSSSPFKDIEFDCKMPLDILSENMTLKTWNTLLDEFRNEEAFENYNGIIILHGTDTLAFSSNLLGITLTHLNLPIILVSSQLPLDNPKNNGNGNFKAAVELIMNKIKPNVYAVYKNSDEKTYVHYGTHLEQCKNFSDDFYSKTMTEIDDLSNAKFEGKSFKENKGLLNELKNLNGNVLCIHPFVGNNYENYCLNNVNAVVHYTYHTEAVCVERSKKQGDFSNNSVLYLAKNCKKNNVDLFLAPCDENAFSYESTGDALENGALGIHNLTNEMAYVKTLVGISLNLSGKKLQGFINNDINSEHI